MFLGSGAAGRINLVSPTWEQRVPDSAVWCTRELCLVLLCPFPVPQGCFRGSALPPRAPVPIGSSFTPGLAKLCGGKGERRRQWLHPNQAARTGGTGGSLGLHGHAQQLAKTQAPNLESSSVSKYHHELKNSPQNETSPGPWAQSFLYTTKPARRLHLHNKKVWFWGERSLFWRSKHKTSPSSMPAGRRLAWQLGAKAGQGPILFPGCFPSCSSPCQHHCHHTELPAHPTKCWTPAGSVSHPSP